MTGQGDGAAGARLTVALTNYNGREMLETMLDSLDRQTLQGFDVVVVDDCSTDDSVQWLREHRPDVLVVQPPRNSGVTAAMNLALESSGGELVAVFNNDMELHPGCLEALVAALEAHPEAGTATPKMLDFRDRAVLDGAGDLLSWRGGGTRRGHGRPDRGEFDRPGEIFAPCGGATLFRREAIERVGGFDEAYYAYYEDIDWAFRAQLAGFACRYVPEAVLYHRGSATLGRGLSDFNAYQLWRNPVWLIVKCFPLASLLVHSPSLLRGQAGNLYVAIRQRKLRVWARAMRDALRGLPSALRKRRAVQAARTVTIARIERAARAGREP